MFFFVSVANEMVINLAYFFLLQMI